MRKHLLCMRFSDRSRCFSFVSLGGNTNEKHILVVKANADGVVTVRDAAILEGMKLLLLEGKLLAEPSACIGIGAVLEGLLPIKPEDRVCFILSGGCVGLEQLKLLEDHENKSAG